MEPRDLDAAATAIVARGLPAHGAIGGYHDVNVQRDAKVSVIAAGKESSQVGSGPALRVPRPPGASPTPSLGKTLLVQEHHVWEPHGWSGDAE